MLLHRCEGVHVWMRGVGIAVACEGLGGAVLTEVRGWSGMRRNWNSRGCQNNRVSKDRPVVKPGVGSGT